MPNLAIAAQQFHHQHRGLMTQFNIAWQRLCRQQIVTPRFVTPSAVVRWLGALQGQDYTGAKWAIGLRLPGSTDVDIEAAIANKVIVRTWALRGTLHLVAAEDLRWLVTLMAPHVLAGTARRFRELGLDEVTLMRSNMLIAHALQDGVPRSRSDLFAMLEAHGLTTGGQRGIHRLLRASLDGLIYQGVAQRNVPTFIALDETLPNSKTLTRDEAVVELARRYFTSHGPATQQDFVWWSGLPTADARMALDALKPQLSQENVGDQCYWMAATHAMDNADNATIANVHLLPGFDEYLLGYRHRSAVLDPHYANRIVPGGNGVFYPTIVSNGRVVGTWKRVFKKGSVVISPQPFTGLTATEHTGFNAAAQRYGEFLGMPVVVTFGKRSGSDW